LEDNLEVGSQVLVQGGFTVDVTFSTSRRNRALHDEAFTRKLTSYSNNKLLVDKDGKVGIQLSGCCDQPKIEVEECDDDKLVPVDPDQTEHPIGQACGLAVQFEAVAGTVYLVKFSCHKLNSADQCTACIL
jgi:hypothetical protein